MKTIELQIRGVKMDVTLNHVTFNHPKTGKIVMLRDEDLDKAFAGEPLALVLAAKKEIKDSIVIAPVVADPDGYFAANDRVKKAMSY